MAQKKPYELEFQIHSSPELLYQYISTATGLSKWFAEDVHVQGDDNFTFFWNGVAEKAKIICQKVDEKIKFKWLNDAESYFEFKILVDEITSDVSLSIIDFAEDEEIEDAKLVWHNQIVDLKHLLGSE